LRRLQNMVSGPSCRLRACDRAAGSKNADVSLHAIT
jgi:hypothetical protein